MDGSYDSRLGELVDGIAVCSLRNPPSGICSPRQTIIQVTAFLLASQDPRRAFDTKSTREACKEFLFSATTDMASRETERMTAARTVCIDFPPHTFFFFFPSMRDFEKEKRSSRWGNKLAPKDPSSAGQSWDPS